LRKSLSYREVGVMLGIPLGTINYHIPVILHKLGTHSREEAVEKAQAQGLLNGEGADLPTGPLHLVIIAT
jgi:DNA-binding CsgD family transcriptional regulator